MSEKFFGEITLDSAEGLGREEPQRRQNMGGWRPTYPGPVPGALGESALGQTRISGGYIIKCSVSFFKSVSWKIHRLVEW